MQRCTMIASNGKYFRQLNFTWSWRDKKWPQV